VKYLLIAVLIVSAPAVPPDAFAAGQRIVFCADGIKYGNESSDADSCKKECFVACSLNELLSEGWGIDSKKPKEVTRTEWTSFLFFESGCTCTGTEYVLSKEEKRH